SARRLTWRSSPRNRWAPPAIPASGNPERRRLSKTVVEEEQLKAILESLLFAAGEPVSIARLGNVLESVPRETIKQALGAMAASYRDGYRGLVLEEIAGGYQLRTPAEHAPYLRRLLAAKP